LYVVNQLGVGVGVAVVVEVEREVEVGVVVVKLDRLDRGGAAAFLAL
jgi:hypothetical protein